MGNLLQVTDLLMNPDDLRFVPKKPQKCTSSKDWIYLEVNELKCHEHQFETGMSFKIILAKAKNQEAF